MFSNSLEIKIPYLERQVSYLFRQLYPKTSNYCLKNRALGFPGRHPGKLVLNLLYFGGFKKPHQTSVTGSLVGGNFGSQQVVPVQLGPRKKPGWLGYIRG